MTIQVWGQTIPEGISVKKENGIWWIYQKSRVTDTTAIPDPPKIVLPPVDPPPVEPPPLEKVIKVNPGTASSIGTAVRMAAAGWTVMPMNGTYNEVDFTVAPGVSIMGESLAGVIVNCLTKKVYPTDKAEENGLIRLHSPSRVNGNQSIRNLTIRGNGLVMGGIYVFNRDNIIIDQIHVENTNFFGVWTSYCKTLQVTNVTTRNASWAGTSFASGEICFVEIDDFLFKNISLSSNLATEGYGFKAIWGVDGSKFRNMYSGVFDNVKVDMHHYSAWANGTSYNIAFEMQSVNYMGKIVIKNSRFENQVSLHSQTCSTGSILMEDVLIDGENDRYGIESIACNVTLRRVKVINTSQMIFNGQPNYQIKNWLIENCEYDQGTAGTFSWGGVILVGRSGAANIVFKNTKIRKRFNNESIRYQADPKTGVTIDGTNPVTTF